MTMNEQTNSVMAASHKTRRYPGVQPFEDSDLHRQLFHGRDREKYDGFGTYI